MTKKKREEAVEGVEAADAYTAYLHGENWAFKDNVGRIHRPFSSEEVAQLAANLALENDPDAEE